MMQMPLHHNVFSSFCHASIAVLAELISIAATINITCWQTGLVLFFLEETSLSCLCPLKLTLNTEKFNVIISIRRSFHLTITPSVTGKTGFTVSMKYG